MRFVKKIHASLFGFLKCVFSKCIFWAKDHYSSTLHPSQFSLYLTPCKLFPLLLSGWPGFTISNVPSPKVTPCHSTLCCVSTCHPCHPPIMSSYPPWPSAHSATASISCRTCQYKSQIKYLALDLLKYSLSITGGLLCANTEYRHDPMPGRAV